MTSAPVAGGGKATIRAIHYPAELPPVLTIIVDCEEGFDWHHPVRGTPFDLVSIGRLPRLIERTSKLGAVLTLMVTYPVLQDDTAWRHLAALVATGGAVLGAHLHPWVTPPFDEAPTIVNSYQGNLPPELEAAKLATLTEAMRARTGRTPILFKAGRSGFGPATAPILAAQGYEADLSYMPCWTYEAQGGPSFVGMTGDPFFFEAPGVQARGRPIPPLLEIPDTAGFSGRARALGHRLFPLIDTSPMRHLRVPAILARTGLLNRVPLTPEGVPQPEAQELTRHLLADGQRVFQLSFHSTSLVPGGTSYVRDDHDVTTLLDWIDDYIRFFTTQLGGTVVTPLDVLAHARDLSGLPGPAPRTRAVARS